MWRIITIGAFAALLSACATVQNKPATNDVLAQMRGKSIVTVQYPIADFSAFTAGNAVFGAIGGLASVGEGNKLIKENSIEDLGNKIGRSVSSRLEATSLFKEVSISNTITTNDDLDALVSANSKSEYVLDVRTRLWMLNYYPTDWSHYRLFYTARLRLIEVKSKQVVAENMCKTVEGNDAKPPNWNELVGNNAALLKRYFDSALIKCSNDFAVNTLKLKADAETMRIMPSTWPNASLASIASTTVQRDTSLQRSNNVTANENNKPSDFNSPSVVRVDDVDAVPYLSERGREHYRTYLTKAPPKAFAIAESGKLWASWGTRPANPQDPIDVAERALTLCAKANNAPCKLYALDNTVVWQASAAPMPANSSIAAPQARESRPGATPNSVPQTNKPASTVRITPDLIQNKTWIYPHPRDAVKFGNVELSFSTNSITAKNLVSTTQGTYQIREDMLCISLESWGDSCFFFFEDADGKYIVSTSTGVKFRVTIR
jgi:hypothetical protein